MKILTKNDGMKGRKMLDLDELEQMVKNTTPGPWKAEISKKYAFTVAIIPPDFPQTMLVGRIRNEQDAAYIVKACTVLPDLIAENKALQEKVQKLEQQKNWLAKNIADVGWCLGCQIAACPNVGSHLDPLLVNREECKEMIIQWAEQITKETKNV